MRIALAQVNPTVGDLVGNRGLVTKAAAGAVEAGADLLVMPELVLTGYPPQDLLLRPAFVEACQRHLRELAAELASGVGAELPVLVGFPQPTPERGPGLYNSVALLRGGAVSDVIRKRLLPTYDVFDELRYFESVVEVQPLVEIAGVPVGVTICEDMWNPAEIGGRRLYEVDPVARLAERGARLLINVSASPYCQGKVDTRLRLVETHARTHGIPFVFCNQVGGNDELLFDGSSCGVDGQGALRALAPMFEEHLLLVDVDPEAGTVSGERAPRPAGEPLEVFRALVMGTRDYARKCGFKTALLGLSGGIDSALTAAVAAEAFGPENVLGVSMPSRFSSDGSKDDAKDLAENLGMKYLVVPIEPIFRAFLGQLEEPFAGRPWNVAEENLQARARGVILMGLSNKLGHLLLTTGNKSELATGYCTLYGDMCGGLALISDVPKQLVYAICSALNEDRGREVVPVSTITKPPSAELAEDQQDSDFLPPYDVLDAILERYVEEQQDVAAIVAAGFERSVVEKVARLVDRNEYKRRQAAPGLRVTSKAFGVGRRYPLAKRITGL